MHVCFSLSQCKICFCSDRNIGPLALQMEAELFSLLGSAFCLQSRDTSLSPTASTTTKSYMHTNTRVYVHPPKHTHAKLTKQTVCDPLKSFSKWAQVTFIPHTLPRTHVHSLFTSQYFRSEHICILIWMLFMSPIVRYDPLALFILSLLKETLILLFFSADGYRFSNWYTFIEVWSKQ